MTDTKKLVRRIEESGLKKKYIAIMLGISRAALSKKIANESEFKASEIAKLCNILGIKSEADRTAIFFANQVA